MFIVDIARIVSTATGAVVIAMWLAGALGCADFELLFQVKP